MRKTFDKQTKEREQATQKAEIERLTEHFNENKESNAYFATLDIDGSAKIMQAVVQHAKKLGKAAYIFSVDSEGSKVVHVNHVPDAIRSKGLDARSWAASVSEVLGGKAGGKEDSAQGVGVNVHKVKEALNVAMDQFSRVSPN